MNEKSSKSSTGTNGEHLEQLARAIAILEGFGREQPVMTLSEAARHADISRAAARRILLTLQNLGYVSSDGNKFSLTPRVLDLGWSYFASTGVDDVARPIMEEVVEEVGESCSLMTLDFPDIVYVARVHTRRMMTIGGGVGSRRPAGITAGGRVLLANLDESAQDTYMPDFTVAKYTSRTITGVEALREELSKVQNDGYALIDQELEVGLRAISVPVLGRDKAPSLAMSVSTNSARATLTDLKRRSLPILKDAADKVSMILAGTIVDDYRPSNHR